MPRLIAVSRVFGKNPQGHLATVYEVFSNLSDLSLGKSVIGKDNSDPSLAIGFFPPIATIQPYTFTFIQALAVNAKRLAEQIPHEYTIIFYDGGLADLWLAGCLAMQRPDIRVIYNFHFADDWAEKFCGLGIRGKFFRSVLKAALRVAPPGLFLYAESARLGGLIGRAVNREVTAFPVFSCFEPKGDDTDSKLFDVTIAPTTDKELSWSMDFTKHLSNLRPSAKIRFQLRRNLEQAAAKTKSVTLVSGFLTTREYEALHSETRCMVLPYESDFYTWGSSGRVEDSLVFHAMPVVPPTTAMYDSLRRRGTGIELESFDAAAVAKATVDYLTSGEKPGKAVTVDDLNSELDRINPIRFSVSRWRLLLKPGAIALYSLQMVFAGLLAVSSKVTYFEALAAELRLLVRRNAVD